VDYSSDSFHTILSPFMLHIPGFFEIGHFLLFSCSSADSEKTMRAGQVMGIKIVSTLVNGREMVTINNKKVFLEQHLSVCTATLAHTAREPLSCFRNICDEFYYSNFPFDTVSRARLQWMMALLCILTTARTHHDSFNVLNHARWPCDL
jgi:hypothetical protein